ncbi:MAG: relaxase/mobilization nuclease domain-containing protein [Ferruginibacter sp.]|nr:relaxase/mobilization nuclease domain-containing protein [Ferruginibacter sp.]
MIGKIIIGKSFGGCIKYCLNDKEQQHVEEVVMEGRAEVLMYNQCYGNAKELISQFNEVRKLNPKLASPVLHITLSLSPGESLPKNKLMEMCEDCAKDMGFDKNQYIAVIHKDTGHQHLHIIANRVGFDRKTVSDSNSYQKIAKYCRKTEQKFELQEVLSPRKFLSEKERLLPRQDIRKEQLKKDIQQVLKATKNYPEFEAKMTAMGYQILKGRVISFTDNKKVKIKGSEVGFPLAKIEKIFALKQEQEKHQIARPQIQFDKQLPPKEAYESYLRQQQSIDLL